MYWRVAVGNQRVAVDPSSHAWRIIDNFPGLINEVLSASVIFIARIQSMTLKDKLSLSVVVKSARFNLIRKVLDSIFRLEAIYIERGCRRFPQFLGRTLG
jgi:hypothetical protein